MKRLIKIAFIFSFILFFGVQEVNAAIETKIWDFNTVGDYTFGPTIEVTGGQGQLKATNININDNTQVEFDAGVYENVRFETDHIELDIKRPVSTANTLIMYYFDETTGDIEDSSGNNYDATVYGSTRGVAGKVENAITLDGVDDYINITDDLGDPSAMTIEFWFKKSNLDQGTRYLMDGRNNGNWWFLQDYQPGNCPTNRNICFNNLVEIPGTMLSDDTWYHVAVTTNTTESKIYLNGNLVDTGAGFDPDLGADVHIGNRFTNSGYINASFDELSIWNVALDSATIADHAQTGYKTSGTYTSDIFDAGQDASWNQISWSEDLKNLSTWLNSNWQKRKKITIDNSGNVSALSNYQVKLEIPYDSDMNTDFSDLRFTTDDKTTEIDFWLQSKIDSIEATVWVEIPSIIASGNTDIYMYYGNSSATSASNGEDTFLFFDNFDDNSVDATKWLETDRPANHIQEVNGELQFIRTSDFGWNEGFISQNTFARSDLSFEYDYEWFANNSSYDAVMMGWHDSGTGASYTNLPYAFYNPGTGSATTVAMAVYEDGSNRSGVTGNWVLNQDYDIRVRMRNSGGAYYEYSTDSGENWNTSYISTYSTESNLKPGWALYAGTHHIDNARVRKWTNPEPTLSYGVETSQNPTDIEFQIRSCDDSACVGEVFVGPDGTAVTYFTDPLGGTIDVSENRYFQYKAFLSNESSDYTSELSSVSVDSSYYDTSTPSLYPSVSLDVPVLTSWSTFLENSTKPTGSEIYYQLSDDDGLTWQYWDGGTWGTAGATDYNIATTVDSHISDFSVNTKKLMFNAFFESNGGVTPQLNELRVDYSGDTNTFNCVKDWPFTVPGNYTFDGGLVEVVGGHAQLFDLGGATYSTEKPSIAPATSYDDYTFNSYDSFIETSTKPTGTEIYYQLSDDDGLTWQYWDGSNWSSEGDGVVTDLNTIALWHFNETSGAVVDSSGNGNDGINNGATRGVSGKFGNGFDFNGSSAFVEVPYDSSLGLINTDFTIEFFINTTDNDGLVLKKYTGIAGGDAWAVRINSGDLEFYDGSSWLSSGTSINDGVMHYIAITGNDTTNTLSFYIDNSLVNTSAFTDLTPNVFSLFIGKEVSDGFFDGLLDDIRISDKIRDASERFAFLNLVNRADVINTNINSFPTSANKIMFKSFLESDGSTQVELDNIRLTCTYFSSTAPDVTIPASITQAVDGSGNVSFDVTVSDANNDDTRLKIEYSDDDGLNWYDPEILSVTPVSGTVDLDNGNNYQIGTVDMIDTSTGSIDLNIVWDTKSTSNGNGSLDGQDLSTIQLRVVSNDMSSDSSIRTTASFEVDNLNPSILSDFASSSADTTSISLTWTPVATEVNFSNYEIWYGTNLASVTSRTSSKWDQSNDASLGVIGSGGTTITGLNSGTSYYFNIWGIDDFGNEIDGGSLNMTTTSSSGGGGGGGGGGGSHTKTCRDKNASNYSITGEHDQSLCEYTIDEAYENSLGGGEVCDESTLLSQNMKKGDRDGKYSSWQRGVITEVKLLQAHMNRLGFASGIVDGILGPISDGAIKRMQAFLGTYQDGMVGPITRSLINHSCGETNEIEITRPVKTNCSIDYHRLIKLGTRGEDVKQVQICMNSLGFSTGIVDGWYGKNTYAGITEYQRSKGLKYIDGIVGPETVSSLNSLSN